MNNNSLSKRFNPFLAKIVKQRRLILLSGRNKKNAARMRLLTDKFGRYAGTKFTDLGSAKFIIRYQDEIREMIIERNHSQIAEFESMLLAASMFNQAKLAL